MSRIQRVFLLLATMSITHSCPWTSSSVADARLLQTLKSWFDRGQQVWENILSRIIYFQRRGMKSICYDYVGCFHVRGPLSHLRQVPDHPLQLQTTLWMCTRDNPDPVDPRTQLVSYDIKSLEGTVFDPSLPIKVIIHGYGGQYKSPNIIAAKNAFLEKEDVIVILVNWQRGARGKYVKAVSNSELVGRQIGKMLAEMASLGTKPSDIHVVGFSLGAQVAGYIGETFKLQGLKLGRITGLDPASLLFEFHSLPPYRRLDHTDASYVEVIHTDGNRIWADGFGLLQPVGHVDYFPNGGVDQPGCRDSYVDVLSFGITRNPNSTGVCSHGRAWEIFLEILTSKHCQFIAFSCPGLKDFRRDFQHGNCFRSCDEWPFNCGVMGAEGKARGALYMVTRPSRPYCGQQLRSTVWTSPTTLATRGVLQMRLYHGTSATDFNFTLASPDLILGGQEMSVVAAAKHGSVKAHVTTNLTATLTFAASEGMKLVDGPQYLLIDRISLMDHHGNSWQNCRGDILLEDGLETSSASITVQLSQVPCL